MDVNEILRTLGIAKPLSPVPEGSFERQQAIDEVKDDFKKALNREIPKAITKVIKSKFEKLNQTQPNEELAKMIVTASDKYKVNPALIAAMLWTESGYDTSAVNKGDKSTDRGIAQINSAAFPGVTDQQAYDPSFAIPFMAQQLAQNTEHFGDINRGIAAYNVGRGGANVQGTEEFGGGPKGQTYLNKVGKNLAPDLIQQLGLKINSKYIE